MNYTDVLILTAAFGNGHNSATKAIREELECKESNLSILEKDMFEVTTPKLKDYLFETYRRLTRSQPALYNRLYRLRSESSRNIIDELMIQLYFDRFEAFMKKQNPRVVVSVFPTCAAFCSKYKETYAPELKLITCITDVVDNWEWIHCNTDKYFVPSEEVRSSLLEKGVDYDKILVTGIPVRHSFKEAHKDCKESLEGKGKKQVLIIGNAMESMGLSKEMLLKIDGIEGLKTVIITGHNQSLYLKLKDAGDYQNIEIIGFTDRIAHYMAESDLIISKAGGATIFEAISLELPLFIQPSNVGQENQNITFIQNHGIGDLIVDDDDFIRKLQSVIVDETYSKDLRHNIRMLKETLEPQRIAPEILDYVAASNPSNRSWVS